MPREMILIGCRLPHGVTLRHPVEKEETVTIAGLNTSKIIGATFVTTPIDLEFWTTWKAAYLDFQPLKSGAIFEARNETEAASKGRDLQKKKTGFEPMNPESAGVRPDKGK